MKLTFKNNFIGYFNFYYSVLGSRFFFNLFLCAVVSFFDGMGLAMFMPLLQAVSSDTTEAGKGSMGNLNFLTEGLLKLGLPLTLNTVLFVLLTLFLIKGIMKFFQLYYQREMGFLFMTKIRFKLINNLQDLSYKGFLNLDAGRIQNTMTTEVQRVSLAMNFYFLSASGAVMLFTYVILAFLANYQFAFLVTAGIGLSNFIFRKIYKLVKKLSISVSQKGNKFNGLLIQAVQNFKYLKTTNYFEIFAKRLAKAVNDIEVLQKKMGIYMAVSQSIKEPIVLGIVVIVIVIQINVMGAELTTVLLSLLLFYRALNFMVAVQTNWQSFVQNTGAIGAVIKLSEEMNEMNEEQIENKFSSIKKEIKINQLEFSYNSHKVLDKINIILPKNQTIALVGESGSGKTTLATIIAGLIQPDNGDILIDNVSLRTYNLNSYRKKIGYISQEPVIFTDNIFNNITFWADKTPEVVDHFWKIIDLASLTDFVNSLPEKENTQLGDNGIFISGGQKQRISIARELFKNVDMLIFDEATSSLDSETEKQIKENVENLQGKFTIILIAHRLTTIKNADIIYLLEGGRILASGTFEVMLEISERFRRIVALQEFSKQN